MLVLLCTLAVPRDGGSQPAPSPAAAAAGIYTIRPGDTLWTFGREYLGRPGDWQRLQDYNRIRDPQLLTPGTRLRVPFAWMRAQPVAARVIGVGGRVDVSRAGTPGTARLVVGAEIGPGDDVTTGVDGSATIELADGSRVVVGPDARIVFDVLSAFKGTGMVDSRLRLERGRVQTQVTPHRGRFRIWTPAAATVVRGTTFRAAFDASGRVARTEVTTGVVETSAAGAQVSVEAGTGVAVTEGAPPAPPRRLLPAPDLGAPVTSRRLPVRIALPAVPGAVAYHLELAPDRPDASLAWVGDATTGVFTPGDLPDGVYVVRARAVDDQGLHGMEASSALTLDARPFAPALMAPAAEATVPEVTPTFRWSRPEGATGYRVQVVPESQRDAAPLVDASIDAEPPFTPTVALVPGRYAWRVATRAAAEEGPFGDWQAFTVRPLPAGPMPAALADAGTVHFTWAAAGPGSRYRVQVARDAAFADLVLDESVATPATSLASPGAGTYYLRVKTIEGDGYEGVFGPVQAFDVAPPPRPARGLPWRLLAPAAAAIGALLIAIL